MDALTSYIGHIVGIHFRSGKTTVCIQTKEAVLTCSAAPHLVQQALHLREDLVHVCVSSGPVMKLAEIRRAEPETILSAHPPMVLARSSSEVSTADLS